MKHEAGAGAWDESARRRHEIAMRAAAVGTWVWHVKTDYVEIDPFLESMFGIAPGSFEGKMTSWPALIHSQDQAQCSAALAQSLEAREPFEISYRVPQLDGSTRWLKSRGEPTEIDKQGNVECIAGATWDVTGETQAREDREQVLAQIERATRMSRIGFWKLDVNTLELELSPEWQALVGMPARSSMPAEYLFEHMAPEDIESYEKALAQALQGGGAIDTAFGWYRPEDGAYMHIRIRGSGEFDEAGNVVRIDGFSIDDTEAHHGRAESQRLLTRAQAVSQLGGLGFWEFYPQDETMDFSLEWRRLCGLPETGLLPASEVVALTHPDEQAQWPASIQQALSEGRPTKQTFRFYHGVTGELMYLRTIGMPRRKESGEIISVTGVAIDETETMLAQAQRDASQAKMDQVLNTGLIGFWTVEAETGAFNFDLGWARMNGVEPDWQPPALDKIIEDFFDPREQPRIAADLERVLETGEPFSGESRFIHAQTRQSRHAQVQANVMRDPKGEIIGLAGFVIDRNEEIEARKQTEAAMARVDEAAVAGKLGFWSIDGTSGALELDDNWRKMAGWDLAAPQPSLFEAMQLVVAEDRDELQQHIDALLGDAAPLDHEYRIERADDGRLRHFHIVGQAHRDAGGAIERYSGHLRDQTDIVERREEVEALRQRYDRAMEAAGIGNFTINLQDQSTRIDNVLAKLLEVDQYEFGGSLQSLISTIIPEDRPVLYNAVEQAIATGEGQAFRHRRRLPNGAIRWLMSRGAIEFSEGGAPQEIAGATWDVTEMVLLNEALERSNADLEDFAYIASHDLREPLRGIYNYADYLGQDYSDKLDDEGRRMIAALKRLTERLDALLTDLLEFSRVGRAELASASTDMDALAREILHTLDFSLAEKSVDVRLPRRLPTIECDRVRVGELLRNLITNAAKYNDKDQKWIEIGCEDGVFYVRDNGIGIAEHNIERVFTIFKRLHGREEYGGGTGAGLTIAKQIAERHGGRLWIDSTLGQGTTFYFTLEPGAS